MFALSGMGRKRRVGSEKKGEVRIKSGRNTGLDH